jgi:hypothetical protein
MATTGPSQGLGASRRRADDGVLPSTCTSPSIPAALADEFPNVMPSFKDTLTEEQIQDLIAYLVTLTN